MRVKTRIKYNGDGTYTVSGWSEWGHEAKYPFKVDQKEAKQIFDNPKSVIDKLWTGK